MIIKRLFIIGILAVLCIGGMSACGSSDAKEKVQDLVEIKEQPDMEIQNPEKIYPEEKLVQDEVVDNSNIKKYVSEYNSKATGTNKIDYDCIRYNRSNNYYYVYDKNKNSGLRFRLGDFGQIISASVYTGNGKTDGVNLVDMATVAMNTFGYNGMSDDDKKTLNEINEKFKATTNEIHNKISLFNGSLSLNASKEGIVNEIEIPAMKSVASDSSIKGSAEKTDKTLSQLKKDAELNKDK